MVGNPIPAERAFRQPLSQGKPLSAGRAVVPLCGWVWGYRIERRGGAVQPLPLRPATAGDWRRVRQALARRHRSWRFAVRFGDDARGFRAPG